jgi:hypothetical protein
MSQKSIALLHLRFMQIYRTLRSVGWLLLLIFVFAGIGIAFPALDNIIKLPRLVTAPLLFLLLLVVHFYRKDKQFLNSLFNYRRALILYIFIEYLLLTSPIWLFQCWRFGGTGLDTLAGIGIAASVFPFMFSYRIVAVKKSLDIIPLKFFEFRFFIEKNPITWLTIWLLGFTGAFHIGFYACWVFIWMMCMPEIFRYFESKEMIHWQEAFVGIKIKHYSLFLMLIITLQTLCVLFFHPDMIFIILYLLLCFLSAVILNISVKYSAYSPLRYDGMVSTITAILTLLMLLPGGIVLTLGYAIRKYIKAEQNIKSMYV